MDRQYHFIVIGEYDACGNLCFHIESETQFAFPEGEIWDDIQEEWMPAEFDELNMDTFRARLDAILTEAKQTRVL